jgi:energy-coupling factor transport system substrate-specific component
MNQDRYYYSTRDLLLMAALAALGGLASTYINFIGDFFQSILGFAGTTQWAAGFHVLWLILAVGLTKKQGAGTITGILKGAVELFSGNTHGLLVVLVDIVTGVLVDLSLLPFRKRHRWLAYAVAGGIASASNVFVFQLFAAVPDDILAYGVMGLIGLMAFVSGVVFAGILGSALLTTLRKSGVVKDQEPQTMKSNVQGIFFAGTLVLAAGIFGYLKVTQPGAGLVDINGAVESPYQFNATDTDIKEETMEVSQGGVSMSYRGYPLQDILQKAQPNPGFDLVLLQASDGYEFFVTKSELEENEGLLLQAQGKDDKLVYNMVGPRTKKAWVNGMVEITLVAPASLEIVVEGQEPRDFQPGAWVQDMDSTNLDVGYGPNKYQGVPLNLALSSEMEDESLSEVVLVADDGEEVTLPVEKVRTDEGVRLFVILEEGSVSYAVAHMNGEFYLTDVKQIRLR